MKWAIIALLASTPAHADTLVDSITRHDVSRLRAKLPDASARCALGVAYIFRDDLTRAAIYLEGCATARIAPGVAGWVRLAVRALDDRLQMSELSPLEVTTRPAGLMVSIDTVPGEVFATPATIWLPAGGHVIRAGETSVGVTLGPRRRAAAHLVLDPAEHAPGVTPLVTVMRTNDCTRHRKRNALASCRMWTRSYDDDYEVCYPRRRPHWYALRHDPLPMILQSAEEL